MPEQPEPLADRNRRTAFLLMGWVALLMTASLIVIWVRN
jgi:hypothetical protein